MIALSDLLIIFVVVTNLMLLGTSRLQACIRAVAVQAVLLAALPLLLAPHLEWRMVAEAVASGAIKGLLLPWLLYLAVRGAAIRRELEPFVGYTLSLLAGLGMLVLSLWLSWKLPLPGQQGFSLLLPTSLLTLLVGLFVIVSRKKAITQVVGYLAMENGIYAFGLAFARRDPLLVEFGILLDAFVAVFVMGIAIYHIQREFDSIDTDQLSVLKD